MKKITAAIFILCFAINTANSACSYRTQKKMLKNRKMVKNKVINAQVKGKMLAIQRLSAEDVCNDPEKKQQILIYQKQIEELTNQKICLKREYKQSLKNLKNSH